MKHFILLLLLFAFTSCKKSESTSSIQIKPLSPGIAHNFILQQLGNNQFHIIDIRPKSDFEYEHIAQSIHIDFLNNPNQLLELTKSHIYLVYANNNDHVIEATQLMKQHHFKSIYYINGGITEWKKVIQSLSPSPSNEY